MEDIAGNLGKLRNQTKEMELRYNRKPGSVNLLAVSKTRSIVEIHKATECGQWHFGENYAQEAIPKIKALNKTEIYWHFIGPLQSNKTRAIAEHFSWVHSVDRIKIARRLDDMRPDDRPLLNICIQLNISGEASKSGIRPDELMDFAEEISKMPRLHLRGLMAMPKPCNNFEQQRRSFRELRKFYCQLNAENPKLDTLSMGTTNDMEASIAEGSTLIRIGTAIFGSRI